MSKKNIVFQELQARKNSPETPGSPASSPSGDQVFLLVQPHTGAAAPPGTAHLLNSRAAQFMFTHLKNNNEEFSELTVSVAENKHLFSVFNILQKQPGAV